jgi:eukaryotic-like serine/threonine-protein kinase
MANSPATRTTIDVGSEIAGTYKIESLLGKGGMGSVFLASHNRLTGKRVAIKLLHAEVSDPEILLRFEREAQIASKLGHPNIVTVHDFNVTADGTPYLVLEYLQGQSLAERLEAGPMPVDSVMSIVRQVGSALATAHREGIVHRDLKPGNIFLVPSEVDGHTVEVAKVLDFGISKIRGSTTVKTQESTLLGTPQYMAPEQAKGMHDTVDERTDVFALGAIVYEMLSGKPAFTGASIPEVVFKVVYEQPAPLQGVAPELVAAIMQAMAKAPEHRFASVGAFVQALTGQPLSQFKVPVPTLLEHGKGPGSSGSGKRSTGDEAFANTMGSDSSPPDATRSLRAPSEPVAPDQPTVESLPPKQPLVVPQKRSRAWIGIVAVLGLAAAGVVGYVVVNRDDPQPPPATPPVIAAAPVVDAAAPVVPDAAIAVVHDAPLPDAAVPAKKPPPTPKPAPPTPTPKPPEDKDEDTKPEVRDHIAEARQAIVHGEYAKAQKIVNEIINSPSGNGPRELAQAHMLRGIIGCARDNEGEALIALRQIPERFVKIRQQMLNACHQKGYLVNER